ncbi:MAG: nickel transporter, partial [Crenarchaeota archaeon]|nr:nickel transporter [Thermoproteota archaeon]
KVVVSLDLMGDRVLNRLEVAALTQPLALLRTFQEAGVSQIIVLDLARVGSGEGVNVSFLKDVLRNITVNVYVGGGVRDIEDLAELKTLGVFGVLIATALHSGKISLEELGRVGLIS